MKKNKKRSNGRRFLMVMSAIMFTVGIFGNAGLKDVRASEGGIESQPVSEVVSLENVLYPDKNGKYSCEYQNAEVGKEYVLLVLSGVYSAADEIQKEELESGLLYIDQKTAKTETVSFDGFAPSKVENSTVFISSENMPVSVVGYISKDLFKRGAYTLDENGTAILGDGMFVKKDTLWQDFKAALPTAGYMQVCSDYAQTVYVPVKLAWRDCEEYSSTTLGNTFEIMADVSLQDDYDAGTFRETLLGMLDPLTIGVTVQEKDIVLQSISASKEKTVYQQGETVDDADLSVQAVYSNGTVRNVTGWTSDASSLSTAEAGTKYLTVTYTEANVTVQSQIAITVVAPAQKEEKFQVSFDTSGGGDLAPRFVEKGSRLEAVEPPVREGFVFRGWYFNGEPWDFETDTVEGDMTLTARWLRKYEKEDGFYCYIEGGETYEYTGKAVKPSFMVMDRNFYVLQSGKDYTVKYTNNVQVSAENTKAKAVITGKGGYTGTVETEFIITPKDIADKENVMLQLKANSAYKEAGLSPAPSGKYNGKTLKNGKDFTVSYEKLEDRDSESGTKVNESYIKEAGYYRVTAEGKGNFTGSTAFIFQIGAKGQKDMGKASVKFTGSAKMIYTGKETVPEGITLKIGKIQLIEGVDYRLEYPKDNVSVGKKTAIARALPASTICYGEKEIKYEITGLPVKSVKVAFKNKKVTYTGTQAADNIESVTVKLDQKKAEMLKSYFGNEVSAGEIYTLKENTDYTVSYGHNEKAGKATVKLTGLGIFSGSTEKKFTIDRAKIDSANIEVTLLNESVPQKKSGAMAGIQAVHTEGENSYILQEGIDYTLQYANNKKVGTNAVVTVKGTGNYAGSLSKTFRIVAKPLDADDIRIVMVDSTEANKKAGYVYKPEILVYDDGVQLKNKTDYTVDYSGCVTQGDVDNGKREGTVVIKGKEGGSYSGSCSTVCRVASDTISGKKCNINIVDQVYTGEPVVFDLQDGKDQAEFTARMTRKDGSLVDLVPGKDFEIINYSNNVACGTAKMVIKGVGDYAGKKTVKFKIVRQRLQ